MSGAGRGEPVERRRSRAAARRRPASAATTANCTAVKPIGRRNGAALPVITTWAAQKTAEIATSMSPVEKALSVPPPSSQVPSADSAAAGHTSGFGRLPLQAQAMKGVMTT